MTVMREIVPGDLLWPMTWSHVSGMQVAVAVRVPWPAPHFNDEAYLVPHFGWVAVDWRWKVKLR